MTKVDLSDYQGQWVAFDYARGKVLASAESHHDLLAKIRREGITGAVITRVAAEGEPLAVGLA